MKRILFIAPSSYPVNGPEAMVNAKHIYVLTQAGYTVDLVCRGVRDMSNYYPSENDTPYFFKGLNSINTVKVDTKWNLSTLYRHFRTLVKTGYIYKACDWSLNAINFCEKNLDIKSYDFILTKDYPSEIAGVYLAKKYNVRWIPTWNDPYMWKKYPAPYGEGPGYRESFFRKRLIKDISKYAYKHLFPSPRLRDYMLKYMYGMKKEDCFVMPHILVDSFLNSSSDRGDNVLRIIHAGSIGVQRDPVNLFRALGKFKAKYPERKIDVTFLGIIQGLSEDFINSEIQKQNIGDIIHFMKPVKYDESFKIVEKFDVCMILEAPCDEGIFLPSKLIDYLQNNKPVFTLSPANGTLNDLFKRGVVDYFADVSDVESIFRSLEGLYDDFTKKALIKEKELSDFCIPTIIKLHKDILFK